MIYQEKYPQLLKGRPFGFEHTEDTKRKIGRKSTRFGHFARYNKVRSSLSGYVNGMKGKKRPDLTAYNKARDTRGSNNPHWKGGINPLVKTIRHLYEYRQWRSDVFTRDNFTCQDCGVKGCFLEAHHITRFTDLITQYSIKTVEDALQCTKLWDINNGETLCEPCHDNTRRKR